MEAWNIRTLKPAPSTCEDIEPFTGTYVEAVLAARESWRRTGRHTSVESGMTYWHTITSTGLATDRNFNSGIPGVEQLYVWPEDR